MEIKFTVSLLLLLLTPWTSLLQTQAETPQVNNAWRCNSISDSKKNHLCRKNRAANLWCRDFSKCQYGSPSLETRTYAHPTTGRLMEVMHCSDEDVARRVGMTCNNFPFYNGGYPVLSKGIDWDDEWEQYECTEINLHGNVCMSWSSKEQSRTEYEIGYSNCTQIAETAAGYHYCQTWKTRQRETKKCDSRSHGCSPNCLEPTYCFKKCCRDSKCYDCSYTPYMELEHAEAECTKVNYKGACLEWKQEEYDEHNIDFREYEVYKCLELSANEQYCRRWVGETDSEEEFEIATCECLDEDAWIQSSSASFCHRWTCYETGYDYYFPNMIWTMLPVSVCGVFVACCGLCIRDGKIEGASAVGVLYIICALCLTMVAATLAGIASVIIATGMIFVIFPMALLLFWWNRKLQAEENDALEPEDVSMHDMMIPVVQAEPLPIFDDQIPIIGPRNQLSRYVESSYYRHVRSTFFLPHQFAD
ncbi:hypothetical protein ACA910_017998 [Epithemia clementina (nom. ined.)]